MQNEHPNMAFEFRRWLDLKPVQTILRFRSDLVNYAVVVMIVTNFPLKCQEQTVLSVT